LALPPVEGVLHLKAARAFGLTMLPALLWARGSRTGALAHSPPALAGAASGLGGVVVLAVVDTAGRVLIRGHTHRDPPGALAAQPIRRREGDLIHPAIAAPGALRPQQHLVSFRHSIGAGSGLAPRPLTASSESEHAIGGITVNIPNSTYVVLDNHLMFWTQPEEFNAALSDFLATVS
jgi:hypothetical protein